MQAILQREIYDNPNKTSKLSTTRCVLAKCIRCIIGFRDGRVLQNANFRQYFIELPFHDGYLFALIHLLPANYRSTLHCCSQEVCDINTKDIILGFAPVFLFIKSYASWLVAELSQLCYKGVLRTIALGSTDGLCQ